VAKVHGREVRSILEVKTPQEPALERGIYAASTSHRYWTLKRPEGRAPVHGRDARPILEVRGFHELDEVFVRMSLPHPPSHRYGAARPPSPGYGETGLGPLPPAFAMLRPSRLRGGVGRSLTRRRVAMARHAVAALLLGDFEMDDQDAAGGGEAVNAKINPAPAFEPA